MQQFSLLPVLLAVAVCVGMPGCHHPSSSDAGSPPAPNPVDLEAEKAALLAMHQGVLQAHLDGDVDAWMALEAEAYTSGNRGEITFPTKAERRSWRQPYLAATTFTAYRDLEPPIVEVSDDGTLGWVIVQVEIAGSQAQEDGSTVPVEAVYAWVELYRKIAGEWKMVGNLSNGRP
jgi:hypothetical protein